MSRKKRKRRWPGPRKVAKRDHKLITALVAARVPVSKWPFTLWLRSDREAKVYEKMFPDD